MLRTVRAFMWLRWRLVANGLRGGQRRDRFEQVSRALAMFVPVILTVLSIGSVIAFSVLGYLAGRAISTGQIDPPSVLLVVRLALGFLTAVIIFFAFWSPIQSSLSRYTRLLLLPVSARTLHAMEFAAAAADPWIAFMAPGLLTFAIGLTVGGENATAVIALVAAVALLAAFAGVASIISFLVSWLFRSRRRTEMFTLVFVLALSLVSLLPAMLGQLDEPRRSGEELEAAQAAAQAAEDDDDALTPYLAWTKGLPSELYGLAIRSGLERRSGVSALAIGALAAQGLVLFFLSASVHRRLIGAVEGDRSRRGGAVRDAREWSVPGLAPATSAVAVTQVRTALRTVRGRIAILLPGPLLAAVTVVMGRIPDEPEISAAITDHGYYLFGAGILFSIYSFQAFAFNLFGSDRSGLTMQFLQPIGDVALARGKLAGLAIVIGITTVLCLLAALAAAPGGAPVMWLATLIGGAATYLWLMPVFVWLSALFPVAADLSKTGSGGNPHGFTILIGTIVVGLSAVPVAGILAASEYLIRRPAVAPLLMLAWLGLGLAVSIPLVTVAARTVGLRRENLATVAQGR